MSEIIKGTKNGFSTVERTAGILKSLSKGINTVTEISIDCGASKTTVHRLLNSMEKAGLVICDSILHRYYLGPMVTKLVYDPRITHEFLISCCADELRHLFEISRETVILDILFGLQHILLYEIPCEHVLKVTEGKPGNKALLSVGATPKVLLSQLTDEELQNVVRGIRDRSLINTSETDQELLMTEIKRIRQEGYAVTYGERIPGVIGISAPVKNYMFPVAIGILGPDSRLVMNVPNLVNEIKESAARISKKLRDTFKFKKPVK
jgi:IclR family transcriptional regulator, KDG regulon repressor